LQLIMNNRSMILHRKGDLIGAIAASTEEETLCRRIGKVRELTVSLENQAVMHSKMKHRQQEREKIEEAYQLASSNSLTDRVSELEEALTKLRRRKSLWQRITG
jgi:hypothetical protein